MFKKHAILIGMTIAMLLLIVATLHYPGGSQYDKNAVGYDWGNNYLSNLFVEKAINGAVNASQPWAVLFMLFLCGSMALFFFEFSKKIPMQGSARTIVRYTGISAMVFEFLAVTPYHDTVLAISSTLGLISMFYITVFTWKSRLYVFKVFCAAHLLISYTCNYVYYSGSYLEWLPVLQKVALFSTITLALSLHYFTSASDFETEKGVALKKQTIQ